VDRFREAIVGDEAQDEEWIEGNGIGGVGRVSADNCRFISSCTKRGAWW
jgi:hypothetical protein